MACSEKLGFSEPTHAINYITNISEVSSIAEAFLPTDSPWNNLNNFKNSLLNGWLIKSI